MLLIVNRVLSNAIMKHPRSNAIIVVVVIVFVANLPCHSQPFGAHSSLEDASALKLPDAKNKQLNQKAHFSEIPVKLSDIETAFEASLRTQSGVDLDAESEAAFKTAFEAAFEAAILSLRQRRNSLENKAEEEKKFHGKKSIIKEDDDDDVADAISKPLNNRGKDKRATNEENILINSIKDAATMNDATNDDANVDDKNNDKVISTVAAAKDAAAPSDGSSGRDYVKFGCGTPPFCFYDFITETPTSCALICGGWGWRVDKCLQEPNCRGVDGKWIVISDWSPCEATCATNGVGVSRRHRKCQQKARLGGLPCRGPAVEVRLCVVKDLRCGQEGDVAKREPTAEKSNVLAFNSVWNRNYAKGEKSETPLM